MKTFVSISLLSGALLSSANAAYAQAQPVPIASSPPTEATPAPVRRVVGLKTAMRDGVQLVSDVWLPSTEGKYPVILIRSPYRARKGRMAQFGDYFASRGYAFVLQDVRGTGDSSGEFDFFFQEAHDGYDTIESLATEPWSNGRLCMMGSSYLGTVQWLAAREKPKHLTCIAPTAPAGQYLDELPMVGGAFLFSWAINWLRNITAAESERGAGAPKVDWKTVLTHRPLLTLDEAAGRSVRLYREWLKHDTLDEYWKRIHLTSQDFAKIDLPIMKTTGFFDGDQPGALFYWKGIEADGPKSANRYLTIGPWTHGETFGGGHEKQGELTLSKDSIIDNKAAHLAFFDHYLKGTGAKPDWPRVRVFVTGANVWRNFDSFPVAAAPAQRLYLSGGGKANGLDGDGALTWDKPDTQPADTFTYDPKNPVPSDLDSSPFGADRTKVQARGDVLVYTTKALVEPVEVIGQVAVELYASSDARDTDFTAAISDVGPDGKAIALGSRPVGVIRARYRKGREAQPTLLTPGKVERFTINLGAIGHRFLPGHRIRVEVSSSAYPSVNPNQNTGNPIATDTEWKVARQTIHHDRVRPSAVILPVFKE